MLVVLTLTGCAGKTASSNTQPTVGLTTSSLTVESFRFIGATTTRKDVEARVGLAMAVVTRSVGYRDTMLYKLSDDSIVVIETDGGSRILSVKHEHTVLFEQPR